MPERNESQQAGVGKSPANEGQFGQGNQGTGQTQQSWPGGQQKDAKGDDQANSGSRNQSEGAGKQTWDAGRESGQAQQSQKGIGQQGANQLDDDAQRSKSAQQGKSGMTGEQAENSSRRNP